MHNNPTRGGVPLHQGAPSQREAAQRGYQDALAGRGYAADYDAMRPIQQRAYEAGRLLARNIRAAGLTPPAWTAPLNRREAASVQAAANRAAARIGDAIPPHVITA